MHLTTRKVAKKLHPSPSQFREKMPSYQRLPTLCCILEGDIDSGGLGTLIPVLGFTIGIAFLGRPVVV
jgi:hypothetical protein